MNNNSNGIIKTLIGIGIFAGGYFVGKCVGWINGMMVTAKAFIEAETKEEEEEETNEEVKEE